MRIAYITYTILAFNLLSYTANAQTIKLLNSTRQSWGGGIAGHYGDYYTFSVAFSDYSNEPLPVTLWVDNEPFVLTITDESTPNGGNMKRKKANGKIVFEISVSTSHDEYMEKEMLLKGENVKKKTPRPPITYKGVALLSYKYGTELKNFIIPKIIINYPPIDYP